MARHTHDGSDTGRRQQRSAADTKARLLQAARELFLRRGFAATGLREIATRAGVDVALVRRYFGSKQQLFVAATDVSQDVMAVHDVPDNEVGRYLIARVLRARKDTDTPIFALLRSSGDPAVVARLDEQFENGLTQSLSARIDANQPRLRADMVTALLIGIGVLRTLLDKEPMATAEDSDITAVFAEAFETLTGMHQD